MLSKTYFFHYRAGSSPATIAFEVDQIHGVVVWDATFCSSKDQFSKEMFKITGLGLSVDQSIYIIKIY